MTQDEIIRMAREAGFDVEPYLLVDAKMDCLKRFAALIAAHERDKQAEQEPVACNCGTNPWHDCNESEGCRIKKTLGISSRPVYDQRADHHKMMLGYEIATKYGVFENKAFQLCDEMKKLYAAPVRTKDLTDDEIESIVDSVGAHEVGCWQHVFARAVIAADREKNK